MPGPRLGAPGADAFSPAAYPAAFAALRAVEELGRRQRLMQRAHLRLGAFCRARELRGDRPQRVAADFRKWRHRLNAAIDPYALSGAGPAATGRAP